MLSSNRKKRLLWNEINCYVIDWTGLLWNEDYTVLEWRWLLGTKKTAMKERHFFHCMKMIAIEWRQFINCYHINWRQLLWNENNCHGIETTVMEWRRLLWNEEDCFRMKTTIINENNCNEMNTTIMEWRRLFWNEEDYFWMKKSTFEWGKHLWEKTLLVEHFKERNIRRKAIAHSKNTF